MMVRLVRFRLFMVCAAMCAAMLAAPQAAHADAILLTPETTLPSCYMTNNVADRWAAIYNAQIQHEASVYGSISSSNIVNLSVTDYPAYSLYYTSGNASWTNPYFNYFCSIGSATLPAGSHILVLAGKRYYTGSGSGIGSLTMDNASDFRVAAYTGTQVIELSKDDTGMYVLPVEAKEIGWSCRFSGTLTTQNRLYFPFSYIYCFPPDAAISEQTKDLLDTSGSDTVSSDAVTSAKGSLDENMGFMEQVNAIGSTFTGITSESDSVVTFPGISVGQFSLPAAEVDIWEHMGALETPCKTICTGVFIFAWFNGMKALYDRIFNGDKDVIID